MPLSQTNKFNTNKLLQYLLQRPYMFQLQPVLIFTKTQHLKIYTAQYAVCQSSMVKCAELMSLCP